MCFIGAIEIVLKTTCATVLTTTVRCMRGRKLPHAKENPCAMSITIFFIIPEHKRGKVRHMMHRALHQAQALVGLHTQSTHKQERAQNKRIHPESDYTNMLYRNPNTEPQMPAVYQAQPELMETYKDHIESIKRYQEYVSTTICGQEVEDYMTYKNNYKATTTECVEEYRGSYGEREIHEALRAGLSNDENARKILVAKHDRIKLEEEIRMSQETYIFQKDIDKRIKEDIDRKIDENIEHAKTCLNAFRENQVDIKEKVLYCSYLRPDSYGSIESILTSTSTSMPALYHTYTVNRDYVFVIFVKQGSTAVPIHVEDDAADQGTNQCCELLLCDERKPEIISRATRNKIRGTDGKVIDYTYEGDELALCVMQLLTEDKWKKLMGQKHVYVCTF